jgi:cytochrome P450
MTAMAAPALFDDAMRHDPYPVYAWLRANAPVHFDPAHGFWVLSRHEDVYAALQDGRLLSGRDESLRALKEAGDEDMALVYNALADMTLFCDGPKHTRLRGLMQKAFTPRALSAMENQVRALVHELLQPHRATGRIEIIADVATPLPMFVICQMLGVRRQDRAQFEAWTADFNTFTGKVNTAAAENDRTVRSMRAMFAYFRERIRALRAQPEHSLLSALVEAEMQGDRLSEHELLANCVLLLAAGFETTTHLLGNGLLALLQNHEALTRLRATPGLMPTAIEELIRFDSSVQFTGRQAACEMVWGDRVFAAGQFVMLLTGSANRDERRFDAPDTLCLDRADNKHLGFGYGPHFCLGAPLARIEARVAFAELIHLPGLRLASGAALQWRDNFSVRGLTALPLAFDV